MEKGKDWIILATMLVGNDDTEASDIYKMTDVTCSMVMDAINQKVDALARSANEIKFPHRANRNAFGSYVWASMVADNILYKWEANDISSLTDFETI